MVHSRHVGTHIQKDKRRDKISPVPQTKKRFLVGTADTYDKAEDLLRTLVTAPDGVLCIRRTKKGFGVYQRVSITKKEKARKSGATGT